MDFSEFEHTQSSVKDNIFKLYLNGFSIEEIKYMIQENLKIIMNIEKINDIIDYTLQTSFSYE